MLRGLRDLGASAAQRERPRRGHSRRCAPARATPCAHRHIVTNAEGESLEWREGVAVSAPTKYALCRCGRSARAGVIGLSSTQPGKNRDVREQQNPSYTIIAL
jgi:hypothetical protein